MAPKIRRSAPATAAASAAILRPSGAAALAGRREFMSIFVSSEHGYLIVTCYLLWFFHPYKACFLGLALFFLMM